jgi:hypothetical protein
MLARWALTIVRRMMMTHPGYYSGGSGGSSYDDGDYDDWDDAEHDDGDRYRS